MITTPEQLAQLEAPPTKAKREIPPMPKEVAAHLKAIKESSKPTLQDGDGQDLLGTGPAEQKSEQALPSIPDDDKIAFLAHLMGAPRFQKTYEMFGGQIRMTFRTRTAIEDEACVRAATKQVPDPAPTKDTSPEEYRAALMQAGADRMRLYSELSMLVSLEKLERANMAPISGLLVDGDLYAEYQAALSGLSHLLLGQIRQTSDRFNALVNTMMLMSDQPGFWMAVSPA
jgi:hypothetical protein